MKSLRAAVGGAARAAKTLSERAATQGATAMLPHLSPLTTARLAALSSPTTAPLSSSASRLRESLAAAEKAKEAQATSDGQKLLSNLEQRTAEARKTLKTCTANYEEARQIFSKYHDDEHKLISHRSKELDPLNYQREVKEGLPNRRSDWNTHNLPGRVAFDPVKEKGVKEKSSQIRRLFKESEMLHLMAQPEPFQAEFNQTIAEEAIGRLPENASFQEIELAINGLESAIKPLGDYLTGSSSRQKNFPHSIETIALQLQNLISGGFTAEDRVNQAALKLYNALAETARRCERGRIPIPSDNTLPESFLRAQDPKIAAPILRQNINTDFTPSFTESQLLASQAKEGHAARLLEERALPPETKGRTNR